MSEHKHEWLAKLVGGVILLGAGIVLFRRNSASAPAAGAGPICVDNCGPMSYPVNDSGSAVVVSPPNPAPGGVPSPGIMPPVPPIPLPPGHPVAPSYPAGPLTLAPSAGGRQQIRVTMPATGSGGGGRSA